MSNFKYDWLLFDLDNTILDFNQSSKIGFSELLKKIAPNLDANELYPLYNKINHQVWDEREAGLISHEELKRKRWQLFFEAYDLKYDPLEANNYYFRFIQTTPFYVDGADKMLEDLKGICSKMIITNGLSEVQWPRIRKMTLEDKFEHIIISDEVGTAKPQKAFFDICKAKMSEDQDPARVLVIGDTLKSDIKGGIQAGFKTCWYNYYAGENDTEYQPDYQVTDQKQLTSIILDNF